jgi:hypothetical protein
VATLASGIIFFNKGDSITLLACQILFHDYYSVFIVCTLTYFSYLYLCLCRSVFGTEFSDVIL